MPEDFSRYVDLLCFYLCLHQFYDLWITWKSFLWIFFMRISLVFFCLELSFGVVTQNIKTLYDYSAIIVCFIM